MLRHQLKIVAGSVIDVFYPNQCEVCQVDLNLNEQHICLSCLYDLPYIKGNLDQEESLKQLFWGRADVSNIRALFNYQKGGQVQDILHLIKYQSKTKLAEFMGEKLGNILAEEHEYDYILPVPLHPKKLRKRGFNQSTVISKGIANVINSKIKENILVRVQHNLSQTKVSKYDRWENVKTIFEVKKPKRIMNKHVLLVDDVLTTGATIEACVNQLLQIEGCKVSVATLAARV